MTNQNLYGFPQPLTQVFPSPIIAQRAPSSTDFQYPLGQEWIDAVGQNAYILVNVTSNSATWAEQGGVSGPVDELTGDSGGAITPNSGNITLAGTADQITTTGSGSTITWSLPSTLIAPGSLEVTSGFQVDAGAVTIASGTSAINISADAAATAINIGTGLADKDITIGSQSTGSSTTIQAGSSGMSIVVDDATLAIVSGTGTLTISNDAVANTVSIGTGAAAKAVTVGSTTSTSALTLRAGSGGITMTGTVTASGTIEAAQVYASADSAGLASTIGLSNTSSSTISTGVGSVKMSTANAATNTEWIKIYIGTSAFWIPAWTTNAP